MYKQSFSCKINCTEIKYTATKLHISPDKTDRAQCWSLFQKKDSDSGSKPDSGGLCLRLRLHTLVKAYENNVRCSCSAFVASCQHQHLKVETNNSFEAESARAIGCFGYQIP